MAGRKVTVFALVQAKPGMEETVKQELLALIGPTRSEEECINYDLHQSDVSLSGEDAANDFAVHIRQAKVAARVAVG